ncbi:hypothetical protein LCGC14_0403910 [marine sediment metagenome]|uniref:Uncharacterized protein n=1 Tax=marine sediment metagenome TaxID=412755 RepID=A0A0F9TDT7_9ZZZZ
MFNINTAVKNLKQRKYDHTHGLPDRPKQYDANVFHIDGTLFDDKATCEHGYIKRRFKNYSKGFGRRLSRRKGQYHRPGGGYAGCTITERKL